MKLLLAEEEFHYDNDQSSLDALFQHLEKHLNESNHILEHMNIDGETIYEGFYEHILERIDDVNTIHIGVKTFDHLLADTVISTEEYVGQAQSKINDLANDFYQNATSKTWESFEQLLEALQSIFRVLDHMKKHLEASPKQKVVEEIEQKIKTDVVSLEEALVSQDTVLIGDILIYEILPSFTTLQPLLQEWIEKGGTHHDTNG